MGIHINAQKNDIAPTVLMPGDPLRAKYIAYNYLSEVTCYNEVRNMYGYTGTYRGERISIQSSGMGIPSMAIYAQELISEFSCKKLMRIGTAGSLQKDIKIGDIAVAVSASTDSSFLKNIFPHISYSPTASTTLLTSLQETARLLKLPIHLGIFFTSDLFYNDNTNLFRTLRKYNCIAVEMETVALYAIAAKFDVQALAICTISDLIFDNQCMSVNQRESGLSTMIELALNSLTL